MLIKLDPEPKLPWNHEILVAIRSPIQDKLYILASRDDPYPYSVHQVGEDGSCHYGDYFKDLDKAKQCIAYRSMLIKGGWSRYTEAETGAEETVDVLVEPSYRGNEK